MWGVLQSGGARLPARRGSGNDKLKFRAKDARVSKVIWILSAFAPLREISVQPRSDERSHNPSTAREDARPTNFCAKLYHSPDVTRLGIQVSFAGEQILCLGRFRSFRASAPQCFRD
jgi:hypothetical protein